MNIMSTIKALAQSEIFRFKEMNDAPATPDLVKEVESARREWQLALKEINFIDSDLDGYIIFKINSTERRYMALLEQARKEGMHAWPELAEFDIADDIPAGSDSSQKEPLCTG
ncbi:MAG: DUF2508 family protein [Desulfotomaculaceae bacterium]|nr:DUF2508 family protein [Desulfotomaculaceae bacterium]MDD4766219.1 DUF2508 family protein [Desulfotomaculaceae bacterium]